MKSCEEHQEIISAYSDNELNDKETSELFFHLGECRECRTFMKSVFQLRSMLQEVALPKSIPSKSIQSPVWKRKITIPYSVAAAIVFFMLVSSVIFFQKVTQPPKVVEKTETEYVYMASYPTVYIYGNSSTEVKSNKGGL